MKKPRISDKVYSIFFLGWLLLSIVFMFAPPNTYVLLIDIGQFFLVFGNMFLFGDKGNKKKIENVWLFLPIIMGILFIVVAILLYCKIEQEIIDSIWQAIICFVFLFSGSILIVAFANKRKKLKSDKYVLIYGKIIGLNDSVTDEGTKVYAPIIEYTFDGQNYTYESNSYSNVGVPSIGDIINIKVNPKNPEEIIFKEPGEWIGLVVGILFIATIVFGLIFMYVFNE